jgi:hypothetical protein
VSQPMVFRGDGTTHDSPSGDDFNAWIHDATLGDGPIFGERMV